ncbi:hypothetical protein GGI43DRAFT_332141 [Trichoderma evansii]
MRKRRMAYLPYLLNAIALLTRNLSEMFQSTARYVHCVRGMALLTLPSVATRAADPLHTFIRNPLLFLRQSLPP